MGTPQKTELNRFADTTYRSAGAETSVWRETTIDMLLRWSKDGRFDVVSRLRSVHLNPQDEPISYIELTLI